MRADPIHLQIIINAPQTAVFKTLADLPNYSTWLSESDVFKGTTEVSDTPLQQGSTYVEKGPLGVRYGTVLELAEPSKIVFGQPMTLKPAFLGLQLKIRVTMTIKDQEGGGSLLERTVELDMPSVFWPLQSTITGKFRTESWRTMEKLKQWLEKGPAKEKVALKLGE